MTANSDQKYPQQTHEPSNPRNAGWQWWSALAIASVSLLIVCLACRKVWTVDYWWLWKTGEYIAHHGIPRADTFSYTVAGQDRIELRWTFCLALYLLTTACGHSAAVVAKTGIVALTFFIAAAVAGIKRHPILVSVVTALAALAASQRYLVRPEVVSLLIFALFIAIISRALQRRTRWVWALPLLQVVWVNAHASFPLGVAVVGCWCVDRTLQQAMAKKRGVIKLTNVCNPWTPWFVLLCTIAACAINPYGIRSLLAAAVSFSIFHGTSQKEQISELWSPLYFLQQGVYHTALVFFMVLAVVLVMSAAMNIRQQRPFWVLVVGAMGYLAFTSVRNIPLFAVVAIPYVAMNISQSWVIQRPWCMRRLPMMRSCTACLLSLACLWQCWTLFTNRFNIWQGDTNQFGIGIANHRFPSRATEFLKSTGVTGPLLNDMGSGSYLLSQDFKVFIDPRGELYMDGVGIELDELVKAPSRFAELEIKYGFRAVLLADEYQSLIIHIANQPGWKLVYLDEVAAVLVRGDAAPDLARLNLKADGERWSKELANRLPPPTSMNSRRWWTPLESPAPYVRLANVCWGLNDFRSAKQWYQRAQAAYPGGFTSYMPLAYASAQTGDWAIAADVYLRAVRLDPDDRTLKLRAAVALINAGRGAEARDMVAPLTGAESIDHEALAIRGASELTARNASEAERLLRKAVSLKPEEAMYHRNLAKALYLGQKFEEGRLEFESAWRIAPADLGIAIDAADLSIQAGQLDHARTWVDRAESIRPGDPRVESVRKRLNSISK